MPDRRIPQRCHTDHAHLGHQRRLVGVPGRDHDRVETRLGGGQHGRQDAVDRPEPPVEPEFAQMHDPIHRHRVDHPVGGERRHSDAEIEGGAVFRQRGGRQIHGEFATREIASGVRDGRAHPVLRLAQRRVGQTDDDESRQLAGDVRLDLDEGAVHSEQRDGMRAGQRHQNTPCRWSSRAGPPGGAITAMASMRIRPPWPGCASHQAPASRRSLRELDHGDGFQRMPEGRPGARLDFDEHRLVAVARDDVDLTRRAAPVALEDGVPALHEMVGGELLASCAEDVFRGHGHLHDEDGATARR